eukprot:TRINITY_DN4096_c0_g1_i2.p1 TRINITY_DN4096_c0_g1~~TRINITY_DN4096_c0_g1_i2.p1  ORF type:complete len:252 (-),score=39.19 TRINITY_DN4096_c0_g1_i2:82-837(-)
MRGTSIAGLVSSSDMSEDIPNIPEQFSFSFKAEFQKFKDSFTVRFISLGICAIIMGAGGNGIIQSTLGKLIKDQFGDNVQIFSVSIGIATMTGIMTSLQWFTEIFGATAYGWLSDKYGRRNVGTAAFLCSTLVLIIGIFFGNGAVFLLIVAMYYAISPGCNVVILAEANSRRDLLGFWMFRDFGAGIGPLFGWVVGNNDMQLYIFIGLAVVYTIAATLIFLTFDKENNGNVNNNDIDTLEMSDGFSSDVLM